MLFSKLPINGIIVFVDAVVTLNLRIQKSTTNTILYKKICENPKECYEVASDPSSMQEPSEIYLFQFIR